MTTFAEELNALRKERHITQEQLAKEMNVSRTAISNWGKRQSVARHRHD